MIVVTTVCVISGLHVATKLGMTHWHILFRELYYLPIILSGLWFGLKGALATSLSITAVYLPFSLLVSDVFSSPFFNNLMEMVLYNVMAVVLGLLSDREKEHHKKILDLERLAAMGKAVSAVAHDFRAPLMAVGGFTLSVLKKLDREDPSYRKLEIVVNETRRLENMIREMLDFARPVELHCRAESVNNVIMECVSLLQTLAEEHMVAFHLELNDGIAPFHFDPERVKQALINLMVNGIQASPQKGFVLIGTSMLEDHVLVEISDSGPGVPAEKREEIFQPFVTNKKGGTGLGLPIVKNILDSHGGKIELSESRCGGASFRLFLPRREAVDTASASGVAPDGPE